MTLAAIPLFLSALPASVAPADPCMMAKATIRSRPASEGGSLRTFTGDVTSSGPFKGRLQLQVNPDFTFTGRFALKARGLGLQHS
jgi:hypothetical protein